MKNIGFTLMAFLLLPFLVTAQKEEWGKHRLKFTPTRLINVFNPGLELGYEYCYGRFSSQVSAAYLFDPFSNTNNSFNGYHLKFEEKLFCRIQPSNNMVKFYLSTEISYNSVKENRNRSFIPAEYKHIDWEEQEQYAYSDNFDSQRKVAVTYLKFGVQIRFRKIKNYSLSHVAV